MIYNIFGDYDLWVKKFRERFLLHSRILGLFVLKILVRKPMHGYQITERINEILNIKVPRQLVYFILLRLEHAGLVSSEWIGNEGRRLRKVYKITDKGKEFIESCVRELKEIVKLLESM